MKELSRNAIVTFCLLAISSANLRADTAPAPAPAAPPASTDTNAAAGPKIQFDNSNFDYGKAMVGQPVKHTFWFTNVGDATLELTAVSPGCGCTTAGEWTKKAEPGQS